MPALSPQRIPEVPKPPPAVGAGREPYRDVLIARMRERADLTDEARMPRGPERKEAVYRDLVATAERSQRPVLDALAALQRDGLVTSYESMFLPNAVVVKTAHGKHEAVAQALQGVAQVEEVRPNRTWKVPPRPSLVATDAKPPVARAGEPEWGVRMVNAPAAWARGLTGKGVTIGIVDTGLDTSHPAIGPHYRGTSGGGQSHDHNWFDPVGGKPAPYDDGQHGTHVGGTTAGGTAEQRIGVAPDAKLIAAKAIMGNGYNTTEATLKALQFMLAPTDVHGRNPDPRKGADVVNNSWGNADQSDTTFVDTYRGLLAAGIEPVTAAGNDGPGRGTVSPPGSYPIGISVAATTSADRVASFSSRGPSKLAPGEVVPMLAAPGAGVKSAVPGNRYASFSGTSMAAPHVAGAVALLLQANPQATHEQIVRALTSTAVDIDAPGPDVSAGHGRIDVDRAALAVAGSAAPPGAAAA